MKAKKKYGINNHLIYFIVLFFISCASSNSRSTNDIQGPFFTGTGGSEIRLGIIVPQSQGLNENQEFLPTMVQGILVSNMNKYSAISVLDRVALDRVITETFDPTYEDNLDIVRLGNVAQVGYMMTGNIIRTSFGFNIQINVTDTTPNASTIASYSGTFTETQINDHSAINRISLELLKQMGVQLTASAERALNRASSSQDRNAQTTLAQGIVADIRGQTVEAFQYYLNAATFEQVSSEALNRMSYSTGRIATGYLGEQIRNDIQQRNEWLKIISDTEKFFLDNPQYNIVEITYSQSLDFVNVDYNREIATFTFPVHKNPNLEKTRAIEEILKNIEYGLMRTGRAKQWGIDLSKTYLWGWGYGNDENTIRTKTYPLYFGYVLDFELLNENGRVISSTTGGNFEAYSYGGHIHNYNDSSNFIFEVRASQITDNLSIRLKNITVYRKNLGNYWTKIKKGRNIITINVN